MQANGMLKDIRANLASSGTDATGRLRSVGYEVRTEGSKLVLEVYGEGRISLPWKPEVSQVRRSQFPR